MLQLFQIEVQMCEPTRWKWLCQMSSTSQALCTDRRCPEARRPKEQQRNRPDYLIGVQAGWLDFCTRHWPCSSVGCFTCRSEHGRRCCRRSKRLIPGLLAAIYWRCNNSYTHDGSWVLFDPTGAKHPCEHDVSNRTHWPSALRPSSRR